MYEKKTDKIYTKMSKSDIEDIHRMIAEDYTYTEIAKHIGCYYANIAYWAKKLGYKRKPRYTHAQKVVIIEKAKAALKGVADEYGLSARNICAMVSHDYTYRYAAQED